MDSPFTVSTSPAINSLVSELVTQRCAFDIKPNKLTRHCSAIFLEKNASCFKTIIYRHQSRQLCYEESEEPERI